MSGHGSLVVKGILAGLLGLLLFAPSHEAHGADDRCTKALCVDRPAFYQGLRRFNKAHPLAQDPKKLRQRSFDAMQDILNHWDTSPELSDPRWLAYIVATVFWETGGHLYPVREGLCDDADCAIAHLEKLWRRRMVRQRYWDPAPSTGQSYYGRGQVQLTHLVNYWRVGGELARTGNQFAEFDDELVAKPDLALRDFVSTTALVEGMVQGWFNDRDGWKGLGRYINEDASNDRAAYLEARRTVNGLDKRDLLADFALEIQRFVKLVPRASVPRTDVDAATAEVPGEGPKSVDGADRKVRRRGAKIDAGRKVGPVRDETESPAKQPQRGAIDFDNPVGPIRNVGVVAGAAGAAARGDLRTPPTKQEQRALRKKRKEREKRRKKRQKRRKKNQKKNRR